MASMDRPALARILGVCKETLEKAEVYGHVSRKMKPIFEAWMEIQKSANRTITQ